MDWLALLLKLAHIGLAMVLVGGLIGRGIVLARAARSADIGHTVELLAASTPFEKMVVSSSMLVLPAGLLTAWAQGYPWLGLTTGWMLVSVVIYLAIIALVPTVFVPRGRRFDQVLDEAKAAGAVTDGLRAAFADPAVRAAHRAELLGISVVVALMVLKPF
jgi:uncharacterized membrane protein